MRSFLNQFKGHNHGPLVQFIKYGIAGGVATGVNIVIFYIMAGFVFPALSPNDEAVIRLNFPSTNVDARVRSNLVVLNNAIAFCFSNTVAYVINIKWVFVPGRHERSIEVLMFFAVSGTSFAVGSGIAWGMVRWIETTTTAGFAANIAASVMINYVMRKYVIFKG
jgi:putative flippase GtrA